MKLWGGRFTKNGGKMVDDFHSSIHFDWRMYREDIEGSVAHARMLGETGVITKAEAEAITEGLAVILRRIENGEVEFSPEAEDIHMNVEKLLIELIGDTGKRLHTGRSRNDQVALDARMVVKREIIEIKGLIKELLQTIAAIAEKNLDTVMPGYTHLQKAQPITLAHHVMAYFEMLKRDCGRLDDCYRRTDVMPLGSGALATTTYPLDRELVARELGFASITQNSLDAVSDRDFIIEFLSAASVIMMHLSRFCEELVLWSSDEFRFVELDDAYSTGSSIMPQKKNPDMAELIRGKSGRVFGHLMGLLATMKGLPLAYNKDMQEDKEALFDTADTLKKCLPVFSAMLSTMKVNQAAMRKGAAGGFTNATDAADYLVKRGLPFRSAHEVIGKLVLACIGKNVAIDELSLEELKTFSPLFDEDVYEAISLNTCVDSRKLTGGPAADAMKVQLELAKKYIETFS